MANALTGDFDVVAEFAIPAADRLLAAMHRSERVPHSITMRVDDHPAPGSKVEPSIVGSVDAFGEATVNHDRIGTRGDLLGQSSAANYSALDPVVNADVVGATVGPVVPSHLRGRAQLQLAPPTIEVADGLGANIRVRVQMMSRYLPDPQTSPLAEFIRGELRMTAAVNQVTSQAANVIDVDIKADSVIINFIPTWSNRPLSAADVAAVNLLIRNALKTGFLPANATLPSDIKHMQFKTLPGAQSAIAVLLNMGLVRGNPGSLSSVFLGAGDDFAFAASKDFILGVLNFQLQPVPPFSTYTVSLQSPSVEFQNGRILLTVKGHAHTPKWYLPDFDFTVTQAFTLRLVAGSVGGPLDTAEIALLGDVSFNAGGIAGWIINLFKGRILGPVRTQRDNTINDVQPTVRKMLSADKNIGAFLRSLLKPAQQRPGVPPQEEIKPTLAYTSFGIGPSGVVLHGSLTVPDWPIAQVEFEEIPTGTGIGGGATSDVFSHGPDYSALKTWIPGGTIEQYEWSSQGQAQPFLVDQHKFVLIHQPPQATSGEAPTGPGPGSFTPEISSGVASTGAVSGFVPLCLTVSGSRIASSGPAVAQPVRATVCGYTSLSIIPAGLVFAPGAALPLVALTEPGPRGLLEVTGHASARLDEAGRGSPNLIVHFADEKSAGHLELLTPALRESGRSDAPTAVLAVLTPDQLARVRHTEGVIYAEDRDRAWERVFGVKTTRRPVTLIAAPNGKVVWQHEGELERATLAAALRRLLVAGGSVRPRMLRSSLKVGRAAPNFLFELAPGKGLTLRKLAGRPAILVFWKSASKPSMEAVRDLQKTTVKSGGQAPVVLAVNDGEAPEWAMRVAAENGLSATVVADAERKISLAYGVNIWPTVVFVDESGLVRRIRYGRFAEENVESPSRDKAAASR